MTSIPISFSGDTIVDANSSPSIPYQYATPFDNVVVNGKIPIIQNGNTFVDTVMSKKVSDFTDSTRATVGPQVDRMDQGYQSIKGNNVGYPNNNPLMGNGTDKGTRVQFASQDTIIPNRPTVIQQDVMNRQVTPVMVGPQQITIPQFNQPTVVTQQPEPIPVVEYIKKEEPNRDIVISSIVMPIAEQEKLKEQPTKFIIREEGVEDQCQDISLPWPTLVLIVIGSAIIIYTAVATNVSPSRRAFAAIILTLWTAIWSVLLYILWSKCYNTTAWWFLIIPLVILLLFFILIIVFNLE